MLELRQTCLALLVVLMLSHRASFSADVHSTWTGSSGFWAEPTNWLHTPPLPSADYPDNDSLTYDAEINSGSISLASPVKVQRFTFSGGTLTGAGITASNLAVWTGGFLDLSAPFEARGGLAVTVAGTISNQAPTTRIYGLSSISGPGTVASAAEWLNEGTLVLSNDLEFVSIDDNNYATIPKLKNRGVLRKEGSGVIRIPASYVFETTGELDVRSGGLMTPYRASYSGLIRCASNSFVEIVNEFAIDAAFPSNTVFAGPGSMHITNGGYENARAAANGSFVLSNSAKVEISAGFLLLQGPAVIQRGSLIELSGPGRAILSSQDLTNYGTIAFARVPTDPDRRPGMEGKMVNAGLIDMQDDFETSTYYGLAPRIQNAGIIQKSQGTNTTRFKMIGNNRGLMAAYSGTLILEGAITNAARLLADTNSRLIIWSDFGGLGAESPVVLSEGSRFEGGGTNILSRSIVLSGHSTNAGTLELGYPAPFDQTGIYLSGTGVLHNTGTMIVRKGFSTARMHSEGLLIQQSDFSGRIDNTGLFQVEQGTFGAYEYSSLTGLVENAGITVKRTGATWQTSASAIFNNHGVFDLQEGTVNWSASGLHSGKFITAAGRTNTFLNATNHFLGGASFAGNGDAVFKGGRCIFDGLVTNTGSLVIDRGTIAGLGDLVTESGGKFWWKDGAILGTGEVVIRSGATAQFGTGYQFENDRLERRIVNYGFLQTIGSFATGPGRLENFGTMQVGGARFTVDGSGQAPPLINFGNLTVQSNRYLEAFRCTNAGTVRFEPGSRLSSFFSGFGVPIYVQISGETIFDHATNQYTRMLILGGVFTGEGDINEVLAVTNASVSVGFPVGRLRVDTLRMASNTVLNIDLGGTQPGTGHDQITVTGGLSPGVAGVIHVRLTNGFAPVLGDRFTILNGFLHHTMNYRFRGLNLGNGLRLAPYRTPSELSLVVVPTPTAVVAPKITLNDQYRVRLSWPAELQGFQILSATNVTGPWQPAYSYTDSGGSFLFWRQPQNFYRLVDLEEP